jgi:hypothetical protein
VIVDDGDGMTEDALARGWLRLSTSIKRTMKRMRLMTRRGRTPLGEKGLVRVHEDWRRLNHAIDPGVDHDARGGSTPVVIEQPVHGTRSMGTPGHCERNLW